MCDTRGLKDPIGLEVSPSEFPLPYACSYVSSAPARPKQEIVMKQEAGNYVQSDLSVLYLTQR